MASRCVRKGRPDGTPTAGAGGNDCRMLPAQTESKAICALCRPPRPAPQARIRAGADIGRPPKNPRASRSLDAASHCRAPWPGERPWRPDDLGPVTEDKNLVTASVDLKCAGMRTNGRPSNSGAGHGLGPGRDGTRGDLRPGGLP